MENAVRSGNNQAALQELPALQKIVDDGRQDHDIKSQVADRLTALIKSLDEQLRAG